MLGAGLLISPIVSIAKALGKNEPAVFNDGNGKSGHIRFVHKWPDCIIYKVKIGRFHTLASPDGSISRLIALRITTYLEKSVSLIMEVLKFILVVSKRQSVTRGVSAGFLFPNGQGRA